MQGQQMQCFVEKEYEGLRIDKFLSEMEEDISRTYIQRLINDHQVTISGVAVKAGYKVRTGDCIDYVIPEPVELNIEAENIPLDIMYEDEDVILINKPKGMVVHPAAGHYSGTLVNGLMYHCMNELSGINGVLRPGIVHRIDRDTTGVIIACKNDKAHQCIAEQLKEHSITRRYNALVYHPFKEMEGRIDAPIGRHPIDRKKMAINYKNGKEAITNYKVLENLGGKYAHIECVLETGRTHQIRVHMSSINHPLLGDEVYGIQKEKFKLEGQCLHARVLGFIHPSTKRYMEFEAPLPEYFEELMDKLRG